MWVVNALACCTGFAYATLTTVPFMLITAYHENREVTIIPDSFLF